MSLKCTNCLSFVGLCRQWLGTALLFDNWLPWFSSWSGLILGLSQKPTVVTTPLVEGQQATLTCTAPGLCSGSDPTFTWTWRGAEEEDSNLMGNITNFKNKCQTCVTWKHSSTLTFNPSAEHHGTEVTCKVSFAGNVSTEETLTLNVTCE